MDSILGSISVVEYNEPLLYYVYLQSQLSLNCILQENIVVL